MPKRQVRYGKKSRKHSFTARDLSMDLIDLPVSDFYLFVDARFDYEQLQNQYMDEPTQTAETARIITGLRALRTTLDPVSLRPFAGCASRSLYEHTHVPLMADLIYSGSWFYSRLPARLQHFEVVMVPEEPPPPDEPLIGGYLYSVVSPEWKAVIEELEPGIHEFFAHKLTFQDGSASDRYIFRTRTQIDGGVVPNVSCIPIRNPEAPHELHNLCWMGPGRQGYGVDVRVNAELLTGHHWIRCDGHQTLHVVSRALAERLRPLLPPACFLVSMKNLDRDGM
jgi:hypothetical protein